jgi:hypothetical protein
MLIYSQANTTIYLGGGIGSRQNDVQVGNGSLTVINNATAGAFAINQFVPLTTHTYGANPDAVIQGYDINNGGVLTLYNGDTTISAAQKLGILQWAGKDDLSNGYTMGQIICSAQSSPSSGSNGGGNLDFLTAALGNGSFPTTRMRIDYLGNVGIGETIPTQKLHVSGNARVTGAYYDSNNDPGTPGQLLSSTVTGTDWIDGSAIPGVPAGSGTINYLARWTPDNDTLGIGVTYDNGTNVGIGTNNPQEKLHIYSTGAGPVRAEIESTQATDAIIKYTNSIGSYATFLTQSGQFSIYDYNAASHRFYMLTNGNVGIGTTSPGAKLEVNGGTLSVSGSGSGFGVVKLGDPTISTPYVGVYRSAAAAIATSGNFLNLGGYDGIAFTTGAAQLSGQPERMRITENGNVGIGTTSPAEKLHIKSTASSSSSMLYLENAAWAGNMTTGIAFKNGANYLGHTAKIYTIMNGSGNQGGEIRFATLDYSGTNPNPNTTLVDRMTIDDNGRVGIGTTSPTALLTLESSSFDPYPGIDIKSTNTYPGSKIRFLDSSGSEVSTIESFSNPALLYLQLNYGSIASYSSTLTLGGGFLHLSTAGSERMRITDTGNVGIGITNPQTKLHLGTVSSSSGGTVEELRIETGSSGGFGGEAKLWLKNGQYGVSTIGLGPQDGTGNPTTYIKYEDFGNKFYIMLEYLLIPQVTYVWAPYLHLTN